ncbi:hypothetical protein EHQ61_11940 [Leptospira wolffii]|nr:hypothetical protein LEP1GSC061_3422 [Leptospira wolffii serovar Khorat str. Khorat-H2]TGL49172.1 hypothetical protein EHQ61_11940 [Leptospira wolffii]
MALRGKATRIVAASLALFTLAFFLHSGPSSSPYPGKKPLSTQTIVGFETEYDEQSDLAEGSEISELVFGDLYSSKIDKPGLSQLNPSRQDRFQFQHIKLLSKHLLNIPPPSLS